jgi:SpoVK/Ycf46/Vps4 family AAA+-type ATPase
MARSDLVLSLVKTGIRGDLPLFVKTAEAIAAEARNRQHYQFADKLAAVLIDIDQSSSLKSIASSELSNAFYETLPQKMLSDLILPDTVSVLCNELIDEHQRRDLLRSYNMEPRHKVLLSGPPGNGKTTLAEAIANQLSLPFLHVKYEGIISRYLGETSQQLDRLFEHVKTRRCVVFFDEFDSISKDRGDEHDNGEVKRVVNSLLKQIDNLPSHVIVIGATNYEKSLDKAMWRRFHLQMTLPQPTKLMAEQWLKDFEERTDQGFGVECVQIAERLEGLSFSEIEEFALDIRRRFILGLPESEQNIQQITQEKLDLFFNKKDNKRNN